MKRFNGFRKARLVAMDKFPFFRTMLARLQFFECHQVKTVAIDKHSRVYVNVVFWETLTLEEQAAVIVHELQHVFRKHFARALGLSLDKTAMNICMDCEINDSPMLRKMLPKNGAFPGNYGWDAGLMFEEYAQLWRKNPPQEPEDPQVGSGDCGSGATGQPEDYELPSPADGGPGLDETQTEISITQTAKDIQQHVQEHGRGRIGASLVEHAKAILAPPKISWQSQLRAFARNAAERVRGQGDYSYSQRSRFQPMGCGVVYPGGITPIPEVSILVDTSASMGTSDLEKLLPEAQACLRVSAGSSGKVCICDTKVHSLKTITNVRDIPLVGRGGTDLRVGFEAISKLRPRPDILVVFTDGGTSWPKEALRGTRTIVALCGRWKESPDSVPSWCKVVDIPNN